jgi:hypothetical protein
MITSLEQITLANELQIILTIEGKVYAYKRVEPKPFDSVSFEEYYNEQFGDEED